MTTLINGGMVSPLRITRGLSSVAIVNPGCCHGEDGEVNHAILADIAASTAEGNDFAVSIATTHDASTWTATAEDTPAFQATIDSETC